MVRVCGPFLYILFARNSVYTFKTHNIARARHANNRHSWSCHVLSVFAAHCYLQCGRSTVDDSRRTSPGGRWARTVRDGEGEIDLVLLRLRNTTAHSSRGIARGLCSAYTLLLGLVPVLDGPRRSCAMWRVGAFDEKHGADARGSLSLIYLFK